jgi:ankyrin repeat protein
VGGRPTIESVTDGDHTGIPAARLLLDAGADPNASDNNGHDAIWWARKRGRFEFAEYIVQWKKHH